VQIRMSRLGLAAGAVGLSLMMLTAGPAGAAQPKQSLTAAGSDTTFFMMSPIMAHYAASKSNTNHDVLTNIPPVNASPFPTSVTVPADGVHPAMTWDSSSAAATPPNGSSAGITALGNDTTGQISWARSSRGPNPGETAKYNFWAFALGAVDYVTFPNTDAPVKGLTQAQIIGIYTCNPSTHQPFFSDWSQVGGKPGGIVRYAPQAGSGTLSFFQTKLLNGGTVDSNCDSSHLATRLEEHDATGVSSVTFQNAIYMYDWGKFRAQKTGFEKNLTNGAVLGKYGTTTATIQGPSTSNVNETKNRYQATRYLFNVVKKTAHPASDAQQLNDVTRLIGVRTAANGGPQYICSGKAKADIIKAGFEPLGKFNTGGIGLGQSFCRLNPTAL
jgi:phosphate transport system substrate-binding protein